MKPKVLITREVYEEAVEILKDHAHVEWNRSGHALGEDGLAERMVDKRAVICQLTDPLTERVVRAGSDLEVVANVAVGYDNIDVKACTHRRIAVTNTPGVLAETSADLAFGLLLSVTRRIPESERFLRDGRWREWAIDLLCGQDVHGRVIGIVGLGQIGRAMIPRALGFGMTVLYSTRTKRPEMESERVHGVPWEELLARSDFVSLHVPLTEATLHLMGARELALMKRSAFLINTSRGSVVDEAALADALHTGVIAGAGLDVFEREPTIHSRLASAPNTVLLPHVASASVATRRRMCVMASESVLAVLRGERPRHLVNPEILTG